MKQTRLFISPQLHLGEDFVTKTAAILAQRRKGKTYTASVIAEEMVAIHVPFVVLDPTGAWWGLRASADGKSEGLPVTILGGLHGDVPIERTDGEAVAELVVDTPGHYVIDFSSFDSGRAEKDFATDFAKRLYRRKGQAGADFPMHVFVDEANRFVPQVIRDRSEGDQAMLGAFETLVLRGGLRGLGTTLISQRAAVVNKNVLEQIDILIMLRIVGPNDQKAMNDYVKANGTVEEQRELMGSLASLRIGEAWVWEPGGDPPLFERVQIRERHTFNSSATPKPGERRVEPRKLAAVDLQKVMTSLASTIEKAKQDDPKELLKLLKERDVRIHGLERDKARYAEKLAVEPKVVTETVTETVHVPYVPAEVMEEIKKWLHRVHEVTVPPRLELGGDSVLTKEEVKALAAQDVRRTGTTSRGPRAVANRPGPDRPPQRPDPPAGREPRSAPLPGLAEGDPDRPLSSTQREILTCLAQYPDGVDQQKVARLIGKKYTRGYRNNVYDLRGRAFLEGSSERLFATKEGLAALGDWEPLPTGDALFQWWIDSGKLSALEQAILGELVFIHPGTVGQENLAGLLHRDYTRGYRNAVYKLRGLGLLTGKAHDLRASDEIVDR